MDEFLPLLLDSVELSFRIADPGAISKCWAVYCDPEREAPVNGTLIQPGVYSARRLSMGFTAAARRAGSQLAKAAAPTNPLKASA